MAKTGIVVHDAEKIYALIEALDLPPRPTRRGAGTGKRAAFAEKIGCAHGSIWNLPYQPWIGTRLAEKIAGGLGVEVGDITAAAGDEQPEDAAEPEGEAA